MALALAGVAGLSAGCFSGSGDPAEPLPGSGDIDPADVYPEGPYGASVGKVIANYKFDGYARPGRGLGDDFRHQLALGDFYNPTGEGTFPSDSPFDPGEPLPRALVINVSAVWCGPCKHEAQSVLPDKYAHYLPLGAELMLVLADSLNPGEPASFGNLDNWVSAYDSTYPSVIDPSYQLGALFDTSSFPANFIIDTRDMSIVEVVSGVPQDSFWNRLDDLLASATE